MPDSTSWREGAISRRGGGQPDRSACSLLPGRTVGDAGGFALCPGLPCATAALEPGFAVPEVTPLDAGATVLTAVHGGGGSGGRAIRGLASVGFGARGCGLGGWRDVIGHVNLHPQGANMGEEEEARVEGREGLRFAVVAPEAEVAPNCLCAVVAGPRRDCGGERHRLGTNG